MIIECTSCHARYQYDEDRFERKPSKKIKCAKCSTIFEIHNPAFAARPTPSDKGESTAPRPVERHDETRTRPPAAKQDTTEQSPIPERSTGQVNTPALPKGKRLSLAVINGNDAGTVYRIEKPRVTVGRSGADFTLNDTEASRQHAAVEVRDVVILLEDLRSTNGTLIDGQRITELTELQDKSEFQVGATTLMLIVTEDA